jgi:hypothetical protein
MQISELTNRQLELIINNQNEPNFIAFNKMYAEDGKELKNVYTSIPRSINAGSFGTIYRIDNNK